MTTRITPVERLRRSVVRRTTGLFAHGSDPMAHTMQYAGDPGLFGPDSITWEVMGDVSGFVAGIRALLIQAAHPEVVAGVADHSRYREDPLGRLSRTSDYVTATSYGAMPEVERAVRIVRAAHRRVQGVSHRGLPYGADDPPLAAWVHNSLTDSFLACNQAYGARPLSTAEADEFVREQARIGRLLDADPVPETAAELSCWVAEHPSIAPSPGMLEAVAFLRRPPLEPVVLVGYQVLASAAIVTLPPRIRGALGLRPRPAAREVGLAATGAMRWALAASPRWRQALLRVGAPVDERRFKQKAPFETLERINERPEVHSRYTADALWSSPDISEMMLRYHLDGEVDLASRRSDFIDASVAWIRQAFGLGAGSRVIDLGCGPGLYANRLARTGAAVTGIDFSPRSIDYARDRAARDSLEIDYRLGDYLELDIEPGYDLATMIMCDYCALSPQQRTRLLGRVAEMLAPGGAFLFDVYSLAYFETWEEMAAYGDGMMDGFWSAAPYYGFQNTFKYEAEKVVLEKYLIVERDRSSEYFNWFQHFDVASLTSEVEAAGLAIDGLYGDVAGEPFEPSLPEFAVVAQRP